MPYADCCTCRDLEDDHDPECPIHGDLTNWHRLILVAREYGYELTLDEDERHDR
jgi:hypothetical protein